MLRFLLNVSIAPLPAKDLNETLCCVSYWIYLLLRYQPKNDELYAEFLTEFIYYSLYQLKN